MAHTTEPLQRHRKTMKKNSEPEDEHELEILKAVAQAWHGHSGSCRTTNEFDAHRRNFKSKPTRFMLQAISISKVSSTKKEHGSGNWDFGQSLWDSYEIVTISKKLEAGLVFDSHFSELDDPSPLAKMRKESKNSLRNILNRVSSGRFNDRTIPHHNEVTQF